MSQAIEPQANESRSSGESCERLNFHLPLPPGNVDPRRHVRAILENAGMKSDAAKKLVECELTISPVTGFRRLSELLEGRYDKHGHWIEASTESKIAGAKFVEFLRWDGVGSSPEALTPNEKELLLVPGLDISMKAGFSQRLRAYTDTQTQTQAILELFGLDIAPKEERLLGASRRCIEAACELLGSGSDWTETD